MPFIFTSSPTFGNVFDGIIVIDSVPSEITKQPTSKAIKDSVTLPFTLTILSLYLLGDERMSEIFSVLLNGKLKEVLLQEKIGIMERHRKRFINMLNLCLSVCLSTEGS